MHGRVRSWRVPALGSSLLCAAAAVLGQASPAGALPPAGGTEAIALIFGGNQLQATCPNGTGPIQLGPSAFAAGTISGSGTSSCDANPVNATPDGATFTNTAVVTAGPVTFSAVSAACTKGSNVTTGSVDVLSGAPGAPFSSSTPTIIVDVNGNQYRLNQVTNNGTFVTRTAIEVLSGPDAGAIIGRVSCPLSAYPLAVETAAPAASRLPVGESPIGGARPSPALLVAGAAALVAFQAGLVVWLRRRPAPHPAA